MRFNGRGDARAITAVLAGFGNAVTGPPTVALLVALGCASGCGPASGPRSKAATAPGASGAARSSRALRSAAEERASRVAPEDFSWLDGPKTVRTDIEALLAKRSRTPRACGSGAPSSGSRRAACETREKFLSALADALAPSEALQRWRASERQRLETLRRQLLLEFRRRGLDGYGQPDHPEERWMAELARYAKEKRRRQADAQRVELRSLGELAACAGAPLGTTALLQSELQPECADAWLTPLLRDRHIDDELLAAALGWVLNARLDRLDFEAPALFGAATSDALERYRTERLQPARERAIERVLEVSAPLEGLPTHSYGRLVALLARIDALQRIVRQQYAATGSLPGDYVARKALIKGVDDDSAELRDRISGARRAALELGEQLGILRMPGLRKLLRIDRANTEQFPHRWALVPRPHWTDNGGTGRVARRLPSFYSELLLSDAQLAEHVHELVMKGFPARLRRYLSLETASPRQALAAAQGRVMLGLVYESPEQFGWADALLVGQPSTQETRWLAAMIATYRYARGETVNWTDPKRFSALAELAKEPLVPGAEPYPALARFSRARALVASERSEAFKQLGQALGELQCSEYDLGMVDTWGGVLDMPRLPRPLEYDSVEPYHWLADDWGRGKAGWYSTGRSIRSGHHTKGLCERP